MSAIYLGPQRDPGLSTYKCEHCRKLMKGPQHLHGSRCVYCEHPTSLRVVTRVTRQMVLEAQEAMA